MLFQSKKGIDKTTTVINLVSAFAAAGRRVLLVDMDPQKNASTGLGVCSLSVSLYEVLLGIASIQQAITSNFLPSLQVLGSDNCLAAAKIELIPLADGKKSFLTYFSL